jgi:cytochrome c peroxidase
VDKGRNALTNDPDDEYRFKIPSLRNVALTAPYFHDGSAETLEEAVQKMAWYQAGLELTNEDINDIAAFLRTLTDKSRDPNRNARAVAEK